MNDFHTEYVRLQGDNDLLNTPQTSRRSFLRTLASTGAGMLGMGAFLQSCAEKKVAPSSGLVAAYIEKLGSILHEVHDRELPKVQQAAALAIQAKLEGNDLYALMTGGMLIGEMNSARPGLPLLFITDNVSQAIRNDYVITNDPYAVKGLTNRLVKIIGITRPDIVSNETPEGVLANMGTFRIEDVSDVVIYSHIPCTDGILEVNGLDFPLGPVSGIVHTFLFNALAAEIAEGLTGKGVYPRIG